MEKLSSEIRWYLLFLKKTEFEIIQIFEAYRGMGVEPILIKGWAAGLNYPDDHPRFFGDIDLAVPANDFDRCLKRNRSERFSTLGIDLHRELRRLDTSPWSELISRSQLVKVDETTVRVLGPEDHLRVLCTHWLTDGGQYKERLWDIYYAIENRPIGFDWRICLESVSETRQNWLRTAIAITGKYLDLNTKDLPFAAELQSYPAWVDRCLAKEWASDVRLRSIDTFLDDRKLFWKQLRKRIPPNPIQATIEAEAPFDERSRIPFQIRSIIKRSRPSARRLFRGILNKPWAGKNR